VELASGIDALYLSGRAVLSGSLLRRLEAGKGRAQASGEPVPFSFGGVEFGLAGHGWGRYAYRLSHEHGLVGLTASGHLPAVRLQPRAEFLHGLGTEAAVEAFSDLVGLEVPDLRWSVARVDLFADFQGWNLRAKDRDRFVCRATTLNTFEESEELTGFQFGRRAGGGLSARIYEKAGQAARTGAAWWPAVWGEHYRPGVPVWRVEFEAGRTMLRELSIDTPQDLFANLGGLWGYATDWLSLRSPTPDSTRSRWPVAPQWETVRRASLRGDAVGLQRTLGGKQAASERRVVSGLCGYLSSFGALRHASTIGEALAQADPALREWEQETGIPFTARVEKKLRRWGWGE
jgi:hypothetical protein